VPGELRIHLGEATHRAGVWRGVLRGGVPVYFAESEPYFGRDGIYGPNGSDFVDSLERFAFLSHASLAVCAHVGFAPDIVHANDWPTALVPALLRRATSPLAGPVGTVFTIHNLGYQGVFPLQAACAVGLDSGWLHPRGFEHYGTLNLLQGAAHCADVLTTVSPTYAREIQQSAFGCGLDGVMRARGDELVGVLNGVDADAWNPETDPCLPAHYEAGDLEGKRACKAALQCAAGLPVRADVPLLGLVSRLTYQKGLDVLARALARVLQLDLQMVLLGNGDQQAQDFFEMASRARPDRFHAWIGFDAGLAHRIEAGCDFFVMPSRCEPCGLNQLYSLRYGTLPIVRATGGLDDAVDNYDEATGAGTGFKVRDLTPGSLFDVIAWAVSTWYDRRAHIEQMRRRAMGLDLSWERAALAYARVYCRALAPHASTPRLAQTR
jgi:starch synthase